uniref:FkbM family methyltransferase n=1 Tax=Eubacterium cellulosolvens TaxID=29322 RepID=UPI0004892334|nr:FkbM family methyltransferase [[Eubacterium] cellulosolvens]
MNAMDEKIVIFGAGEFGKRLYRQLVNKKIQPVAFIDNAKDRWGTFIGTTEVLSPSSILRIDYDAIAVCVNDYYDDIYAQLVDDFGVDKNKIRHWTYWSRVDFLDYYEERQSVVSDEVQSIVEYVKKHDRLKAFNYDYVSEYEKKAKCVWDDKYNLYYTVYAGKKLYLKRKYKTKDVAEKYVNSILLEQDIRSPHRYLDDSFTFDGGCLLDAGAAEGNFSIELIEKADKVILVEANAEWIEALQATFSKWIDKVVIINKYLSDKDSDDSITIDTISEDYSIDFIKMDIEGAEREAIKGGMKTLKESERLKMAVCTYHNIDDEMHIREILEPIGYQGKTTNGYMAFPDNIYQPPRLVKGVLRLQKRD